MRTSYKLFDIRQLKCVFIRIHYNFSNAKATHN